MLVDGTRPVTEEDRAILAMAEGAPGDCAGHQGGPARLFAAGAGGVLALSSVTSQGLEALEREIAERFPDGGGDSGEILTSRRQAQAVGRAAQCLEAVFEGMERGMTPDAVLSDVGLALDALGRGHRPGGQGRRDGAHL